MAHFAQIDQNNIVLQVLVIDQAEIDTGNWGEPSTWVQTSYNTRGGVYYTPNTETPDADQSKAFRKNYAGVGFMWITNGPNGEGFAPPQPFPSWVMDDFSYLWKAPVEEPQRPWPDEVVGYKWDENIRGWVAIKKADIPQQPQGEQV